MEYTLVLWHADHVNFGRLLSLLEGELDVVHEGGSPDYEMMLDIMYYMTHYSDAVHHPKEDLLFARIRARDETVGPAVDALSSQHAQLRDMGEALVHALGNVMNDEIAPRARIEATARAYVSALRAHMRTEEREMLPCAARVLKESDWAEINAAVAGVDDPLFGAQVAERYAGLRDQIHRLARPTRPTAG
jgi:hemerythrin-like domain-containing protein